MRLKSIARLTILYVAICKALSTDMILGQGTILSANLAVDGETIHEHKIDCT